MTLELPEAFNFIRILYTLNTHLRGPNVTRFHSVTSRFPDTRLSKKYNVHTECSPLRPKFHPNSLYAQAFSSYKVVENRKGTEWPQNDLNYLSIKGTLYTLITHPCGPNFAPFRSTIGRFRDTRLSEIGNAPNALRITLTT